MLFQARLTEQWILCKYWNVYFCGKQFAVQKNAKIQNISQTKYLDRLHMSSVSDIRYLTLIIKFPLSPLNCNFFHAVLFWSACLCLFKCCFKCFEILKVDKHRWQANGRFSWWIVSKCLLKTDACVNFLLHWSHWYGLSPAVKLFLLNLNVSEFKEMKLCFTCVFVRMVLEISGSEKFLIANFTGKTWNFWDSFMNEFFVLCQNVRLSEWSIALVTLEPFSCIPKMCGWKSRFLLKFHVWYNGLKDGYDHHEPGKQIGPIKSLICIASSSRISAMSFACELNEGL